MTWREEQEAETATALAEQEEIQARDAAEAQATADAIGRAARDALVAGGAAEDWAEDQGPRLAEAVYGLDVAARRQRRLRKTRADLLAALRRWERDAGTRDARKTLARVRARVEAVTKF